MANNVFAIFRCAKNHCLKFYHFRLCEIKYDVDVRFREYNEKYVKVGASEVTWTSSSGDANNNSPYFSSMTEGCFHFSLVYAATK